MFQIKCPFRINREFSLVKYEEKTELYVEDVYSMDSMDPYDRMIWDYIISDRSLTESAIKAILLNMNKSVGRYSNSISETNSRKMFQSSLMEDIAKTLGIPRIDFRGIHQAYFSIIATGRSRMTLELYSTHFIPKFSMCLQERLKTLCSLMPLIRLALVGLLFGQTPEKRQGLWDGVFAIVQRHIEEFDSKVPRIKQVP
ncbi:unnamed protein product [Calicophoron daubneyi]|uniref:Uncharacterized protein n=1 Tax=Calicophoron daubneyi TaxID=300641 RepID=A0AAV2T096_CALDB